MKTARIRKLYKSAFRILIVFILFIISSIYVLAVLTLKLLYYTHLTLMAVNLQTDRQTKKKPDEPDIEPLGLFIFRGSVRGAAKKPFCYEMFFVRRKKSLDIFKISRLN